MRSRGIASPLIKSLLFVVVTGLATAILALSIANTGVGKAVRYKADFTDVTGLNSGDSIRIAGVQVGQVDSIRIVNRRYARVTFSVQADRRLPGSTTATIKYLNLVGQRFVELNQGVGPVGQTLSHGGLIPVSRTTPALNLTDLFNGFQPLFQALSPGDVNQLAGELIQVLQGESTTVDSLVANIGSLTTTVAGKDKVIGQVIDNLNSVLRTIDSRGNELSTLVTTLQRLVSGLAADRRPIGQAITAIGDLASSTAGLLRLGRPGLDQDIAQLGRVSTTLDANTPVVETFLKNLPVKFAQITRLASYGSWLNLYMCDALVSGVQVLGGGPPPTGVPITAGRCK